MMEYPNAGEEQEAKDQMQIPATDEETKQIEDMESRMVEANDGDADAEEEDLENRFTYHPPKNEAQADKYGMIRGQAKQLALLIWRTCPKSPERDRAIDAVDTAVMHANAAIARRS